VDLGLLDELFEAMTLIQTKKSQDSLLYCRERVFLVRIEWIKQLIEGEHKVGPDDLNLIKLLMSKTK
jgi:predicted Rossmann-fold nucleotide-binding protein